MNQGQNLEQDIQYVGRELGQGVQNIGQGLRYAGQEFKKEFEQADQETENILTKFLSWKHWELLTHLAIVILFVCVAYLLYTNPLERTVTNWLLLLIALAVAVQIHQNINVQRGLLKIQY